MAGALGPRAGRWPTGIRRPWWKLGLALAEALRDVDRRMATVPDAVRAELSALLHTVNRRLVLFKAINGRQPRRDEWRLITDGGLR